MNDFLRVFILKNRMEGEYMEKQILLSTISEKFNQMGIKYSIGNATDITVSAEFLDAGWSTGSKKINYEASIFADDVSNTVFMWEMTKEVGQGLSFGGESDSYFQNGKTLFRKVKCVQYGLDGKAYEYTLDLGAIPKAAKETAAQYGWKFKTVLSKNKAMYPSGYVSAFIQPTAGQPQPQPPVRASGFCGNCGMPIAADTAFCNNCGKPMGAVPHVPQTVGQQQQQYIPPQPIYSQPSQNTYSQPQQSQQNYTQYNNPQGQFYANTPKKNSSKGGTFGMVGFILLGIVMAVLLAVGKATLIGWGVSAIVFAVSFFIQRKLAKKGCLLNLILWIITGFIMLVILTAVTTGSLNFTTANLKNAHMTTDMDSSKEPVDDVKSYTVNAPKLVCVAELHNAPANTKIKFAWTYVTGNTPIIEFNMDSGDKGSSVYVFSNITNDKPWPKGEYKVEIYIEDRKTPDAAVNFKVTD